MKIKYSALVSGVSGKLNGSVAAHNKGGAYIRNKGIVSNPQTVAQQLNRSQFGAISSQFRSLTPAQIAGWNSAAPDFPYRDQFGDTRYLSGFQLYVQLNKNLADAGLPGISNPPAKASFPEIEDVGFQFNLRTGESSSLMSFEVQFAGTPVLGDFVFMAKMSPPLAASITNSNNRMRVVGVQDSPGTNGFEFGNVNAYKALFGTPAEGQKIFAEGYLVHKASGEKSAPIKIEAIVIDEV